MLPNVVAVDFFREGTPRGSSTSSTASADGRQTVGSAAAGAGVVESAI